jgi:hypothetical protein
MLDVVLVESVSCTEPFTLVVASTMEIVRFVLRSCPVPDTPPIAIGAVPVRVVVVGTAPTPAAVCPCPEAAMPALESVSFFQYPIAESYWIRSLSAGESASTL